MAHTGDGIANRLDQYRARHRKGVARYEHDTCISLRKSEGILLSNLSLLKNLVAPYAQVSTGQRAVDQYWTTHSRSVLDIAKAYQPDTDHQPPSAYGASVGAALSTWAQHTLSQYRTSHSTDVARAMKVPDMA
eukprot:2771893-Rhodomonas_salina.5